MNAKIVTLETNIDSPSDSLDSIGDIILVLKSIMYVTKAILEFFINEVNKSLAYSYVLLS